MIALMKRILNVAGGYKGRIQLAFVFSFLKSLLAKAPIGMAFLVLTAFLDGSAGSRLCLTMGAAMAICLVLQVLCQHAADRLQSAAGFMVFAEKRMELGAHLRKLPMGYFTEGNIGKISSVLSTDMVFIEENCMTALADMMSYIFAEAIMLAFLFVIHPWLGLAGCALMLLVLAIAKGMRREGLEDSDIRQAQSENLTEAVLDFAEGIGIIKTYNLLGEKSAELTENFRESRKTSIDFEENHAPWQRRLNGVWAGRGRRGGTDAVPAQPRAFGFLSRRGSHAVCVRPVRPNEGPVRPEFPPDGNEQLHGPDRGGLCRGGAIGQRDGPHPCPERRPRGGVSECQFRLRGEGNAA